MTRRLLIVLMLLVPTVASAADSTPRVVAKIKVGIAPCAGVAGFGAFWQTNYGTATLSRINPKTNKVTKTGKLGFQPCGIAVGAGSIWIDGYGTAKVERVNPRTLKVVKRIAVGAAVWDVAYAFGSVWATNNLDGSVSRIDPATNRIVKTIATGGNPANLGAGADAIGVGKNGPDASSVSRIDRDTNASPPALNGRKRPIGIVLTASGVWV